METHRRSLRRDIAAAIFVTVPVALLPLSLLAILFPRGVAEHWRVYALCFGVPFAAASILLLWHRRRPELGAAFGPIAEAGGLGRALAVSAIVAGAAFFAACIAGLGILRWVLSPGL